MTEEEAKAKWCPMVRIQWRRGDHEAAVNRLATGESKPGMQCIGSACMMWRWRLRFESVDWVGKDFSKEQAKLEAAGGHVESINHLDPSGMIATPSDHGYCGLAGKP